MKKIKTLTLLLLFMGLLFKTHGQDYYDTICWVWVGNPSFQPVPGEKLSNNNDLNTLFSQNNVVYYEKAYPYARTLELLKIHEIRCSHGTNIDDVITSLTNRFGNIFYNFSKIEKINVFPADYDPVDWMWRDPNHNYLWHLKKTQANLAWDITQGDTLVKTAVLDYLIDEEHPDIVTEIIPSNYPYPEPPNIDTIPAFLLLLTDNPRYLHHGTAVASFVSAETTKQGETSFGQLASVGFDTKIIPYRLVMGALEITRNDFLQKALHSSTVVGADVIVSCAGGAILCSPNIASGEDLVMKEILNNGTVIVMPAGNGPTSPYYCGDEYHAIEHYPFNSSYDERVIVVTSTDSLDYHRYTINGIDKTHSHFPAVDICAPGYHLMGAEHTHFAPNPNWPYYGDNNGTSFAAPIVAGACALLKSINRDFTPGEIQYFIKSTADPVMDESDFPGMLGAGRLNVYRAVQMANNCSPGIISSSNTLWNKDTTVVCGVEITQGACLTISSKVKLSKHSPIIVHQGGKLIIDGGFLTSLDETMWPGIEVWGDYYASQEPIHGSYAQGYLELKNGAVIENAVSAVELWRPDHWSTTGGIIHATDATFRNNAKAVHALCYTNISPYTNQEIGYDAIFVNCDFVVDGNYLGTETFHRHVELADVRGITFSGCSFSAERRAEGVDPWCVGINAYDAGFGVNSHCTSHFIAPCPEADLDRSSFTGLCTGIRSTSTGNHPRSFVVGGAVFSHNDIGIYAENTGYPSILSNDFDIGGQDVCQYNYGIQLFNVSGFCIEENTFHVSSSPDATTVGVAVYGSQGVNDVYLNGFSGLSVGNLAKGDNTTAFNGGTAPPGLTYSCNTNSGNLNDFLVQRESRTGDIQSQQGSLARPAGNTFSASSYHFYNDGVNEVDYYYNSINAGEQPSPSKLYRVNRYATSNVNPCNSHYGGGGHVVKSSSEKATLAAEYLSARNAYASLKLLCEGYASNGGPSTQSAAGASTLKGLVALMGMYGHDYRLAAGDIVRSNLNDSVADPAELRTWLGNMDDIAADRMAVASYLEEGDTASAFALARALPARYGLQGDGLEDHADYMRLVGLYHALNGSGRNAYRMTEAEKALVDDIADNGTGVSRSMAQCLREQVAGVTRCACTDPGTPGRPDGGGDRTGAGDSAVTETAAFTATLAPNPATTWTAVDYALPEGKTRAAVTLANPLGITVLSAELDGRQGKKALDLRGLSGGVYTYTIRCGEHLKTGKLVVTR